MRRLVSFCLLPLLAACASARPASAPDAAHRAQVDRELSAVYDRFVDAYRRGPRAVSRHLRGQRVLPPAGRRGHAGRAGDPGGVESFLNPIRQRGGPFPNVSFEIVDRDVRGDLTYDIGYYRFEGRRAGKFIVIWKREADGKWRMWADGYSDVPAAAR